MTRLPATRALAAELGVARGTVSAAYDQLVAEGWLVARVGAGTEVARSDRRPHRTAPAPATAPYPAFDLRPGSPDVGASRRPPGCGPPAGRSPTAPATAYGYGDPRGRPELRAALAGYLGRARGVLADPERIVVTTGYVQALALLTTRAAGRGGRSLAMEDPGLPFHREVVRRQGGMRAAAAGGRPGCPHRAAARGRWPTSRRRW